jgi:hypothetical protein
MNLPISSYSFNFRAEEGSRWDLFWSDSGSVKNLIFRHIGSILSADEGVSKSKSFSRNVHDHKKEPIMPPFKEIGKALA